MKKYVATLHKNISCIKKVINAPCLSVTRRDLFDTKSIELGQRYHGMRSIGVKTRLSSTFKVIEFAYKARTVLNACVNRIP